MWSPSQLAEISKYVSLTDLVILNSTGDPRISASFSDAHVACKLETPRCFLYWRIFFERTKSHFTNVESLYSNSRVSSNIDHFPKGIKKIVAGSVLNEVDIPETVEVISATCIDDQVTFLGTPSVVIEREKGMYNEFDGSDGYHSGKPRLPRQIVKLKLHKDCPLGPYHGYMYDSAGVLRPYCECTAPKRMVKDCLVVRDTVGVLEPKYNDKVSDAMRYLPLSVKHLYVNLSLDSCSVFINDIFEHLPKHVEFIQLMLRNCTYSMKTEHLERVYRQGTKISVHHGLRTSVPEEHIKFFMIYQIFEFYNPDVMMRVDGITQRNPRLTLC